MLVAISRNSEAKAMMRNGTHTLRYQRAAAASREATLSYIDISIRICWMGCGYCRGKFCFPLRRASTHFIFFSFFFSQCIQDVIGCLTFCDFYFRFIIHSSYIHISTFLRINGILVFLLQRCLNWEKLYRFYFLSRAFLSPSNYIYICKHKAINLWICRCISVFYLLHISVFLFFSFDHRASSQA